jgi:hypothetical protein
MAAAFNTTKTKFQISGDVAPIPLLGAGVKASTEQSHRGSGVFRKGAAYNPHHNTHVNQGSTRLNQCISITGFMVKEKRVFGQPKIIPLKAGAGPHRLPDGGDFNSGHGTSAVLAGPRNEDEDSDDDRESGDV